MILKLWCWLWGHKTTVKENIALPEKTIDGSLWTKYRMQRYSFCLRCGKKL